MSDGWDEYREVGANLRHHDTLRFAQLTLFATLSGGLLALISVVTDDPWIAQAAKVLGLVLVAVFFVLESRSRASWWHYRKRGAELDGTLGTNQYSSTPSRPRVFNSDNAVGLLFVGMGLFWALRLFFGW